MLRCRGSASLFRPTDQFVRAYWNSLYYVPAPRSKYQRHVEACERPENLTDGMSSAKDFLRAIGRDVEKKVLVEKWEDLFRMRRNDFKTLGVGVQDRRSIFPAQIVARGSHSYRYVMWAMEKYRWGTEPADFAHETKPKKKHRGRACQFICVSRHTDAFALSSRGSRVQHGKRVR